MIIKSGIAAAMIAAGISLAHAHQSDSYRFIVKYKTAVPSFKLLDQGLQKATGFKLQSEKPMAGGAYVLSLTAPGMKAGKQASKVDILHYLNTRPEVAFAVIDRVGQIRPLPEIEQKTQTNLLSHSSQWDEFSPPAGVMLESAPGMADGAWAYTQGQSVNPVVVAVLDTGVALHESLVDNLVKGTEGKPWGWNFAGNNADISDETGSYHGTHVSGTIAAYGNVVQGMGNQLKILTVKIPDKSGMFYESAVINAIYWAAGAEVPGAPINHHPAKVINMSFGVDAYPGKEIDHCDQALQEAVTFARNQGTVLVAAAGNDNHWEYYNAPAVCNGIVRVASTGPEGLRSYFSNYGPGITFAAPGGDKHYGQRGGILSTVNPRGGYEHSGYAFYQGTSMASPHVAGLAGLIHAVSEQSLSATKIEQIMYVTTHDFGVSNNSDKDCIGVKPCGHGIIDAEQAVKATHANYDVLFSAPDIEASMNAFCTANKSLKKQIKSQGQTWKLASKACEQSLLSAHASVTQDKQGQIFAQYGALKLQLDISSFQSCQKIGYDGIGCYQ